MAAVDHHLAPGFLPLEVVGLRQGDVALAAVVDVAHLAAIHRDRPAEHADVGQPLTDLEAGQQLAIPHHQLQQAGVLVVGVQLAEVLHEAGLAEKAALQRQRLGLEALRLFAQAVQGEHVLDAGFLLEAEKHVVAEQQAVADLDDVAGDAVVLGADAHPAEHRHLAGAELGQALGVKRIAALAQALALLGQAPLQHLVGAALGDGLIHHVLFAAGVLGIRHRCAS
ncbi:hypothetical protein D3C78_610080 [compost metagenome]